MDTTILNQLLHAIKTATEKDSWVIVDKDGKQHPLDAGVAGTPKQISESDIKKEITNRVFGKERVSADDIVRFIQLSDSLADFFYHNTSYASRKSLKKKIVEYYNKHSLVNTLKEIKM